MHSVLNVQEILIHILSFALGSIEYPSPGALKTVCAVAFTCRTLSAPALDVLWAHQHAMGPLMQCLPDDILDSFYIQKRGHWIKHFVSMSFLSFRTILTWGSSYRFLKDHQLHLTGSVLTSMLHELGGWIWVHILTHHWIITFGEL
jgi:hypothetical protein